MRSDVHRVPGFTAEAAMRPASKRYPGTPAAWATTDAAGAIAPSLIGLGGSGLDCVLGCICVQPEGCPCCDPVVIPPQPSTLFAAPQAKAWMSCPVGTEEACTAVCDNHGGGMQSNPDGSMTCTIY